MEIPNLDIISLEKLDALCEKSKEMIQNDTEWESIIETHPEEFDKLIKEQKSYSKSVLRDKLTKKELDQIPFPYKTTATRSRATEIVNWLEDHQSLKTMDIQLLRQRIFNHFVTKIHDSCYLKQERISSITDRIYKQRRELVNSHKWIHI